MKRYEYHVYNSSDTFITIWDDVISEFSLSQEINSAGSQCRVMLGRKPEDIQSATDIVLNNHVDIYVIDDDSDALQGKLIFQGYIADFNVLYSEENDAVEVILLGFGADLDAYIIDMGDSIINENRDTNISFAARNANNYVVAQSFILTKKTRVVSITLRLKSSDDSPITVGIYSGTPSTYGSGTNYATITKSGLQTIFGEVEFQFSNPVDLDAGTYHFRVESLAHGSSVNNYIESTNLADLFTNGAVYQCADSTTDPTQTFALIGGGVVNGSYDLWFKINAGTIQPFYTQDPSDILKKILDYYANAGGIISYTGSTIDDTNVDTTYQFNTNTVFEGVKKCLELAPSDWYWYVDQKTNLLHFHKRSTTPEHLLALGKNISKLNVEYRTENIINVVYFTGGNGLFKKYTRQGSITLYGQKAFRYTDQRVTQPETARIISEAILEQNQAPEVRLTVEIIDNADSVHGLDLESIDVGDVVKFRNFGTTDGSIWDVSSWDVAYWDFNAKQLDTFILQIVKIDYMADKSVLHLSTIPPDVNKRIEDINRRLVATETVNNDTVTT